MSNATITGYEVRYVTEVDRPELRDSTYPVVRAGTRVVTDLKCATQRGAIRLAEDLLGGWLDFASEYVCKVAVYRVYEGRSPARVRRPVARSERGAAWVPHPG